MSDLEALWRAVLASPDEDTPRLMYADEVQESDPARAELVRVQCRIAKWPPPYDICPGCGYEPADGYHHNRPDCPYAREFDLLSKANRERWEPACVACAGKGKHYARNSPGHPSAWLQCTACNGTGRQPCRWERGFPVVQVAEMRQVWRVGPTVHKFQFQWEPTPWLRALLRTHHVAGVVPGDERLARGESVPPRVWELWELMGAGKLAMPALGRAVVLAALEWLDAQGET